MLRTSMLQWTCRFGRWAYLGFTKKSAARDDEFRSCNMHPQPQPQVEPFLQLPFFQSCFPTPPWWAVSQTSYTDTQCRRFRHGLMWFGLSEWEQLTMTLALDYIGDWGQDNAYPTKDWRRAIRCFLVQIILLLCVTYQKMRSLNDFSIKIESLATWVFESF